MIPNFWYGCSKVIRNEIVLLIFYLYINLNTSLLLLVKFVFVIKISQKELQISVIYTTIFILTLLIHIKGISNLYIQIISLRRNHCKTKNKKHRPNSQSCGLQIPMKVHITRNKVMVKQP